MVDCCLTLSMTTKLETEFAGDGLGEGYSGHPVVQRTEGLVHPYVLYADAVPYSLVDSAIGIFVYFLFNAQRR